MTAIKVLLTGANGFIGSHILDALLRHGLQVTAVVRSELKATQVRRDFPATEDQLNFVIVPDISAPGAYTKILKADPSVQYIIHTASPLNYSLGKTVEDFVNPAVRGTREILEAAAQYGCNVQRVVVTGSFAAIGNPEDMQGGGKVYTSQDWNPVTAEKLDARNPRLAYWFSKTLAERAAWAFMDECKRSFDLVVLNPPMVYGPLRHTVESLEELNVTTYNIWRDFLNASPDHPLPHEWVHADIDVRDLAETHYNALFSQAASNKRYLVTRGRICNQEIADILRETIPELRDRVPVGEPGVSSLPRDAFDVDGGAAMEDLQLTVRPAADTFRDLGKQLLLLEAKCLSEHWA
ncbi:methylglyoxal reductase (NADPH-dependent) gre2 [Aspergillus nanangensis]|uniref:Methylglyoxal reductase (NADPH-dependent) gre2 n=1 Tax=Aspergillus nanangensis TaxID=2582783 RepID=A0AAD4GTU8_ASPNN|nr:methylglyoxal reductase (NADPH-dependent) gre2 [Aspergillus nanangensis]